MKTNTGLRTKVRLSGLFAFLAISLLGCSPTPEAAKIQTPQNAEDKIKMIQANTTLTAQQKQEQIARIQAGR